MEREKPNDIFAMNPSFKPHSKTIRSLDNSYYLELWQWIAQKFWFSMVVSCLRKDTSTTPVEKNKELLTTRESSCGDIWISLLIGTELPKIERDDTIDGLLECRCVVKEFFLRIYNFF